MCGASSSKVVLKSHIGGTRGSFIDEKIILGYVILFLIF